MEQYLSANLYDSDHHMTDNEKNNNELWLVSQWNIIW